jgi:hypothetical protein
MNIASDADLGFAFADRAELIFTAGPELPFLSIITRTQGKRPHTLVEVLTCLAAQTDTDFELLILGHHLDGPSRILVNEIIAESPTWLSEKIRLIPVEGGTRTRPLNAGLREARGQYIAVLDDDDAVFAHWVEIFRSLAAASPGRMLRTLTAQQAVDTIYVHGEPGLRADGPPKMVYPAKFDFFDHVVENRSPPVSLAFPRRLIEEHNITFDESLTTTEDWDFMMRVASVGGVAEASVTTSIYRWWERGESSRTLHDKTEWQTNHYRIWDKWNAAPFALPTGTVRELVERLQEHAEFRLELRRLQHEGANVATLAGLAVKDPQTVLTESREVLVQILNSTSWRLTAPLRWLSRLFGSPRPVCLDDIETLNAEQSYAQVTHLRKSTSWQLTAPVRTLKILLENR